MADQPVPPDARLDPFKIAPVPDTAPEITPDVVGTPEGDNEYAPDQPLAPKPELGLETPRGSEPDAYKGEV